MDKEIKSIIDQLLINNALNTVQLQLLEKGIIELANALLSKEQSYNFQTHYLNNLKDNNTKALSDLSEALYNSKASFHAQFDMALAIQHRIDQLSNED